MSKKQENLTVGEVAEYLKCCETTVYNLIKSKQLTAYQPTGKLIIRRKDLENYMERSKV